MQELFLAFLQNPTADSFRAIHDEIVNHPKYDGYSQELREMENAYQQKRFADVKTAFGQAQPNLLLSPGAHLLLSLAMRDEGNAEGSEMERFICFRCLDGIQLTGDGTQERPYLVLRTSDEYDLLGALGKQFSKQGLSHANGKSYDKMTCADGSELWFDITDMFGAMTRRMNAGGS
jgi:hypothetical protein